MQLLEFIGEQPTLAGQICEGFICEGFEFESERLATATVTYLKFGGVWHRLCFDPGTVHWRMWEFEPAPWAIVEEGFNYPHINVGAIAQLVGGRLTSYDTSATEGGATVVFEFENGRKVSIVNHDDRTDFQVA